jgi:hypothetical protein
MSFSKRGLSGKIEAFLAQVTDTHIHRIRLTNGRVWNRFRTGNTTNIALTARSFLGDGCADDSFEFSVQLGVGQTVRCHLRDQKDQREEKSRTTHVLLIKEEINGGIMSCESSVHRIMLTEQHPLCR